MANPQGREEEPRVEVLSTNDARRSIGSVRYVNQNNSTLASKAMKRLLLRYLLLPAIVLSLLVGGFVFLVLLTLL